MSVLGRIWQRFNDCNASLLAAALAFYMVLSLFPGLATLISAYGLIADPKTVADQLDAARDVLPEEVLTLVRAQLDVLLGKPPSTLSVGVLTGAVITFWTARSGAVSAMAVLNHLYGLREERSFVLQQGVGLILTLGGLMTTILALTTIAIIPAILSFLPLPDLAAPLLPSLRWPVIAGVVFVGLTLIYRFAPCRQHETAFTHSILIGAAAASILWILGAVGFSFYASSFGNYDKIYGSIGGVVVLLLWLYVSALAMLIGAIVDFTLAERKVRRDEQRPHPA